MVTRDADALITEKWAATGDVETPESQGLTVATGWPASYSEANGDLPEREVVNYLIRRMFALAVELNAHGLLAWDAGLSYTHPALVFGSDNQAYSSVQDSSAVDPTTDDGTYWVLFGENTTFFDADAITSGVLEDARIPLSIARLASPTFTGTPTAPTPTAGDDSQNLATTAFVQGEQHVLNGTANPTSTDGSDGDLWVRTDTEGVFAKANGAWYRLQVLPQWALLGTWALNSASEAAVGITEADGELLVIDRSDDEVYRYSYTGTYLGKWALDSANDSPAGITEADGEVVVVDNTDNEVYRYSYAGTYLGKWALDSNNTFSAGITEADGEVLVVDSLRDEVYRYSYAGTYLGKWALDSANANPKGIADVNGEVLVVDNTDDEVYRYEYDGTYISKWALDSSNANPNGITEADGEVLVVDPDTDEVYRYNPY